MFFIATTPRSGATYMQRLLTHHGIECTHEIMFPPNIQSYTSIDHVKWGNNEIAWSGVPFLQEIVEHEYTILHQTRNPVGTINTIMDAARHATEAGAPFIPERDYVQPHCPFFRDILDPIQVAEFWYEWHVFIEEHAVYRYQIEKVEACWDEIMGHIGRAETWRPNDIPDRYPPRDRAKTVCFGDLPPHVRDKAKEYGYDE